MDARQCTEERIRRERGSERWILGEGLAWFVHLEEGQKEYLERRKETTKYVDDGKIDVLSQSHPTLRRIPFRHKGPTPH
jgi:hypothetical protein